MTRPRPAIGRTCRGSPRSRAASSTASPTLGLLLATAAHDLNDTADTRSTLLNALEAHPLLDGLLYGNESGLEAAVFSPHGTLIATPTSDGSGTILWDAATHDAR